MIKLTQTKNHKQFKTPDYWRYLLLLVVLAIMTSHFYLLSLKHKADNLSANQTRSAAEQANKEAAHNLDLKLAAKARYNSAAIGEVKDLGVNDGVHAATFKFSVPTDNLTEYGLLMRPATPAPPGGYPAIVLCHAFTAPLRYSTTASYTSDMRFYAKAGFLVVKPDYRGQGLSFGHGQAEGAYYSMAYNTDVMSLITALTKTNYVNKKQINLWGHSLGAYVALRAAVLSPNIKSLILLSGPVDSLSQMYQDYNPPSQRNNPTAQKAANQIFAKYGPPITQTAFWDNASPINWLSQVGAYVQIHVGSADSVVPPRFSADLDAVLSKFNKPHDYFIYDGAGHGLMAQRPQIWDRSLSVMNK